ncbi:MAG: response regulator [Candidatus Omnitrophica bacterium]|nr:response regulator [Candidatus Omnitrophota bacterium]
MSKHILIADDEPTVVAMARQKLEEHGYVVETARNGKEAMRIIEVMQIDLIVLDVIMPEMDGVDVYKELKKDTRTAKIPIVIMTDNRIFRESFQTLGVEHFLPKPLDADKLINKVEYVFTCADLTGGVNKHVLVLSPDLEVNNDIAKLLEAHSLIVGKSTDPIDFISTCLILAPKVVIMDVILRGDIPAPEMIRAFRSFARLRNMKILVFTRFAPGDVDSMEGIEQLRLAKDDCLEAGANKYLGRFSAVTFWEMVKDFTL